MSRLTAIVRFVLALVVFLWLSLPVAGLLTPPDPFSQLVGVGIGSVVTVPVAVWFARRQYSLKRLYGYLLVANIAVMVVGLVGLGVVFLLRTILSISGSTPDVVVSVEGVLFVVVAYFLAFHFVYRGGYARLEARFG